MTDGEEKAYTEGTRAAWSRILTLAAAELGADTSDGRLAALLAERAAVVAKLWEICAGYGSTDWPDDMHLPNVLERHLRRHIEARREEMLELLASIEWSNAAHDDESCPSCGGCKQGYGKPEEQGHREGCDLLAMLDKLEAK